jgi:hypothetical protein
MPEHVLQFFHIDGLADHCGLSVSLVTKDEQWLTGHSTEN